MNGQKPDINCTICDSADVDELLSISEKVKIFVCKNCKNAFTYPKPLLPDYVSDDFQAGDRERSTLTLFTDLAAEIQTSYRKQLKIIERHVAKNSTILEIGGGEGIFLEMVQKSGYNVELIEPSRSASERAMKRGLHVRNNYFQNISFERTYDLVCLGHVLEHMENPIAALTSITHVLSPGGYVLLTQTNFNGFMPSLLKKNWYAWVPTQHFSHFSLKGIHYLAGKVGCRVITHRHSRLFHGKSLYHSTLKYIPFLQDQIHVLLRKL